MLIILGAAHSNSFNAKASRALLPKEKKPEYLTPGITDVIENAQEIILVQKRSEMEKEQRIPLSCIREGVGFYVNIGGLV